MVISKIDYDYEQEETKLYFSHIKPNLHKYSKQKLESLTTFLIDAYYTIYSDKKI